MKLCDLSDDALLRIFSSSALTFKNRLNVLPLVCKRWSDLLQQPSAVWSRVCFKYPDNYGLKEGWLRKRAASIRHLEVDIAESVGPGSYEAAVLVGGLIDVAINSTLLSHLCITGGNRLDMSCEKWLPNLRGLKYLYLEEKAPDHRTCFPSWFLHMNHLTELVHLEIKGDEYDLPYNGSLEYQMLPSALRNMRELETLKLQHLGICAFSEEPFTEDLVEATSHLHMLRDLVLVGFEFSSVNPLARLTNLESLALSWGPYKSFDATPLTKLRHFSYEFYGCAEQMLGMSLVLPEGLESLRISTLGIWRRNPETDEEARHQNRVHVILEFLDTRVSFPAPLRHLDLSGLGLPVVPAPVLRLRNLEKLDMAHNRLEALPLGPWLLKLETVDFTSNPMSIQPSELQEYLPNLKSIYLADNIEQSEKLRQAQALSHRIRTQGGSSSGSRAIQQGE